MMNFHDGSYPANLLWAGLLVITFALTVISLLRNLYFSVNSLDLGSRESAFWRAVLNVLVIISYIGALVFLEYRQ